MLWVKFLARRSGYSVFIRTSSNRWAKNFALDGWALGTRCLSSPARYRHCCPPSRGFLSQRLPFLWLTRVSTTACSFRRRCSSHSTSWSFSSNHWKHTSPELGWKCFIKCREQLFFRGCFIVCFCFFSIERKTISEISGLLRASEGHSYSQCPTHSS